MLWESKNENLKIWKFENLRIWKLGHQKLWIFFDQKYFYEKNLYNENIFSPAIMRRNLGEAQRPTKTGVRRQSPRLLFILQYLKTINLFKKMGFENLRIWKSENLEIWESGNLGIRNFEYFLIKWNLRVDPKQSFVIEIFLYKYFWSKSIQSFWCPSFQILRFSNFQILKFPNLKNII